MLSWTPVCPFYWPVRSLRPEVKPLLYQQDLDKLQDKILEEMEPFQSTATLQPVSYQLENEGQHFDMTLDTEGFSPEPSHEANKGTFADQCGFFHDNYYVTVQTHKLHWWCLDLHGIDNDLGNILFVEFGLCLQLNLIIVTYLTVL